MKGKLLFYLKENKQYATEKYNDYENINGSALENSSSLNQHRLDDNLQNRNYSYSMEK